jgi:hypothetical protein
MANLDTPITGNELCPPSGAVHMMPEQGMHAAHEAHLFASAH